MRRSTSAWGVAFPSAIVGCFLAHALAHDLAPASARSAADVHSYLAYAPLVLALGAAIALVELVRVGARLRAGARPATTPAWLFAAVPPLTFVVQEHVEVALAGGDLASVVLQPAFALGVALQAPFALLAYVVSRSAVATLARLVGARVGPPRSPAGVPLTFVSVPATPRRAAVLAGGHAQRGPPAA